MSLFGGLLDTLNNCPAGERVPEMSPQHLKLRSFFKAPDPPVIPTWEIGLKIAFYIPSIVINLVGNSLVILILAFNKKMRTTTNLLILNLSVSDILVACFCSWIHLVSQVTTGNQWLFGAFMCKFSSFAQGKNQMSYNINYFWVTKNVLFICQHSDIVAQRSIFTFLIITA